MRIAIFIIMMLFATLLLAEGVQPSGSGTAEDPYVVETLDNLQWVSTTHTAWSRHYVQTADIDAHETSGWNNGAGFGPIGGFYDGNIIGSFTGSYDGQGHTISGIRIYNPDGYLLGLFGCASEATIRDVHLNGCHVAGYYYLGALVGRAIECNIADCEITQSTVIGTDHFTGLVAGEALDSAIAGCYTSGLARGEFIVGGLAGRCHNCQIHDSGSTSSVVGSGGVGGVAGSVTGGEILRCYSENFIGADSGAGGLVGSCNDSLLIVDCFNRAAVNGDAYTGGLVGSTLRGVEILRCYNHGLVSGEDVDALVGVADNTTIVQDCFWDTETSGQSTSGCGGTGLSTAQMLSLDIYLDAGWDFLDELVNGDDDVWGINPLENDGYPFLAWQGYEHNPNNPVDDDVVAVPATKLHPAYPNPFNPTTTICYEIAQGERASLVVYNARGQRVRQWGNLAPGRHSVVWDGHDDSGKPVSSGVYLYRLQSASTHQTRKCILLQ